MRLRNGRGAFGCNGFDHDRLCLCTHGVTHVSEQGRRMLVEDLNRARLDRGRVGEKSAPCATWKAVASPGG